MGVDKKSENFLRTNILAIVKCVHGWRRVEEVGRQIDLLGGEVGAESD